MILNQFIKKTKMKLNKIKDVESNLHIFLCSHMNQKKNYKGITYIISKR